MLVSAADHRTVILADLNKKVLFVPADHQAGDRLGV